MRILITGAAGFVGSTLARELLRLVPDAQIIGLDTFYRPGSERNRSVLRKLGIDLRHGDIRNREDVESVPTVDWVIDAAALPSVLAGTGGHGSSRLLMEHNLAGTINLLELCKRDGACFTLLSSSRVYSLGSLASVELEHAETRLRPKAEQAWPTGISEAGVSEDCSTAPPASLYGTTKVCSEQLALEYGATFDLPVWILRCGVLSGAGQFGTAEQGIFSFWMHAHREGRPLRYIGFDGSGHQVRDCLHPRDLGALLVSLWEARATSDATRVLNAAGGADNAMSLQELSTWCAERFGAVEISADLEERPFDVGWLVLDCARIRDAWGWTPKTALPDVLEELAEHARAHPAWLADAQG